MMRGRNLTVNEEKRVAEALSLCGNASEVLSDFENIPVCRHDMRTLRPGVWLNDEVMELYLKLLAATYPDWYFCQTNFYTKLVVQRGYDYNLVQKWTKKVDVFSKVSSQAPALTQ